MNEKKICACVGARTRDTQKSKEHYEENFIPAGWNLEYTCLDQPEAARALYLTGVCLHCGGQLGKKFNIPGELTGDALLEQIYHQMESCRPFDQRFDGGAYRTSLSMRAYQAFRRRAGARSVNRSYCAEIFKSFCKIPL